jgi:hypothetical protein
VARADIESVCRPTSMAAPGGKPGGDAALAVGGCGDASEDGNLTASDALGILKAAVGSKSCLICVCDVDNSNKVTASDALRTLRFVVGQPVTLDCQSDGNPIAWDGGGDGTSWTDGLNWDLDRVPNSCDDATIAAGPTVVYPSGDNGVRNVASAAPLDITGGTLTLRGTINVPALFRMKGGTLVNAHVLVPGNMSPLVFTSSGGTLKAATVDSAIDSSVTSAYAYIDGGLTLNGTAQVGQSGGFFFLGSDEQSLKGTGTISLNASAAQVYNYNNTLHVAPGITIHGANGSVGGNQGTSHMTLDGTVSADAAGILYVGSYASWTNTGTLKAVSSGTMTLAGPWSNTGTLMLDATGTVNLGGTFDTTGIGTVSRTGGTVNLTGQLANTGLTLTLDAAKGTWRFLGGKITGGTVAQSGGSELLFTSSGGDLDGVTLANGADLTASSAYTYVDNGLTLHGTAEIGPNAGFFFLGSNEQMLAGDGTIAFNGSNAQVYNYSNTLHIGPDIHIHGPNGTVGGNQVASHMTLDGTVTADAPGTLYVGSYASWVNNGTLTASGGGNLYLQGPWSNQGTLSLDASSTITMAGTFGTSGLGTISRSGGTINLTGQMNNAASTFTIGPATGDIRFMGGKITGGTVATSGANKLVMTSSGGTLDGATLTGATDFSASSAYTYIDNGLTLNHDVSLLGTSAGLYFLGSGQQSFSGNATVTFAGSNDQVYNYNNTLHIGSGIAIHGPGTVGGNQLQSQMTLDGTVAADVAGITYVGSYASWVNNGTMSATNGGTMTLSGPWANHGTFSLGATGTMNLGGTFATADLGTISRSGGTLNLTGTLTNTATTLTLNGTTGDLRLVNGRINGGTVAQSGAKLLFTTSGGVLNGVSIPGGADLSTSSSYSYVEGDLTLGSTTTMGANAGFYFLNGADHTLGGTATIAFSSNSQVYHYGGITLHIGSGVTIHGSSGTVGSNQASGHIDNHGIINSDAGGTITVGSSGSETWIQAGTLNASAGQIATVGTWANDGTIHVGAGNALQAQSGYKQNSGGTTTIDIGGLSPSSVGKVTVTGAAQLGGTLNVALTNAYVPNLGDTFTIMTFGSSSGSFGTVSGLPIDAGKKFSVAVDAGSVVLTVVAA